MGFKYRESDDHVFRVPQDVNVTRGVQKHSAKQRKQRGEDGGNVRQTADGEQTIGWEMDPPSAEINKTTEKTSKSPVVYDNPTQNGYDTPYSGAHGDSGFVTGSSGKKSERKVTGSENQRKMISRETLSHTSPIENKNESAGSRQRSRTAKESDMIGPFLTDFPQGSPHGRSLHMERDRLSSPSNERRSKSLSEKKVIIINFYKCTHCIGGSSRRIIARPPLCCLKKLPNNHFEQFWVMKPKFH